MKRSATIAREPGLKAQVTAGLVALVTYVVQQYLGIAPTDPMGQAIAPLIAYVAAQLVGWLWARRQTTPITSPRLPEGTPVTLPDGTAGTVVPK